jgi:hypothetical protein
MRTRKAITEPSPLARGRDGDEQTRRDDRPQRENFEQEVPAFEDEAPLASEE